MSTMEQEKTPPSPTVADVDVGAVEAQNRNTRMPVWLSKIASYGVELRGITPVPAEEKVDKRFINIFLVWSTMSINLLPIVTGMLGTLGFGMSLRETSLVILFFSALTCIPAAYFCTFGSRTGLRQMIHGRYTFGFYLISIIVALNLCTLAGFGIISAVLGGSTLAAVSKGSIDSTAGIVIISLVGMIVSFGGYKFVHQYERYSWIFALIAIIIATGVGGKGLTNQPPHVGSPAALIISFGGVIAGFFIPWAAMAADIAVYCDSSAGTARIFWYTYSGLFIPSVPLMVLGAAIGSATTQNEDWMNMYNEFSVGGALQAMLLPAGGFGRFVAVLLSFSVIGNLAATMYAISLNFQVLLPFLVKVPRFTFSIVYTVVCIPVAIQAAKSFFASLENFIYLIAYWSAAYVGVVAAEHFVFRKGNCASYVVEYWNQPKKLPTGLAAIGAMALSFGLVVPCMSQVWFTGPLAKTTGDIGFEVALVLAPILYLPLRWFELKYRPL